MAQAAQPIPENAERERAAPMRPASAPSLGPWDAAGVPHPASSPALLMQQRLAERIAEDGVDRWSWRLTVGFVLVSCSAFWTTVYALLRLLLG